MRRWVGLGGVVGLVVAILLLRPAPPPVPVPTAKRWPPGWTVDRTTAPEFTEPRRVLQAPQAPEPLQRRLSAAGLRAKARTDPAERAKLVGELRDPTLPRAYRALVALVLGSIDDPILQETLAQELQSASDSEWKAILLHALGAEKKMDDDEIFDLEVETPFVYELAGLRPAIHTTIDSERLRRIIVPYLNDPDTEVRRAAARALIHSAGQADVRDAFLSSLSSEGDEGLRAGYGQALAAWAGAHPPGTPERDRTLEKLLAIAAKPDEGAVRFRLEAPLRGQRLAPREVSSLLELAQAGSAEQQLWSLALLTNRPEARGENVEAACGRLTHPAAPSKVREYAVNVLAGLKSAGATATLGRIAASDPDERVRQAAERGLKKTPR